MRKALLLGMVFIALCLCSLSSAQVSGAAEKAFQGSPFLDATLAKQEIYVEEQVLYTLRLFHKTSITDLTLDLPQVADITFHQLGDPVRYEGAHEGETCQVLELKYALVPSREGRYFIGSSTMSMRVSQPGVRSSLGRSQDDAFFSSGSANSVNVSSQAVELDVISFPQEGRPEEFGGLVGHFSLESNLTPSKVKAGETAMLTVLISGTGNVNRVPDLKLPDIPRLKVYADQPVLEISHTPNGLGGSKGMKWALVPEREGAVSIAPFRIEYLDPVARLYRILNSSSHTLTVLPSDGQGNGGLGTSRGAVETSVKAKKPVKQLGLDILPVHTKMEVLYNSNQYWPGGATIWLLILFPALAYACASAAVRYQRRSAQTLAATRARKAAPRLLTRFRGKAPEADQLVLAIRDYLNERFGLSMGSVTPVEVSTILMERGVQPDKAKELALVLERLEAQVYTGRGCDPCSAGEGFPSLIKGIEMDLRGKSWSE